MKVGLVDLHIHTDISDSSLSIEETLFLANLQGVKYLAITDHDTGNGIRKATELEQKYKISIIPGIELSAYDFNENKKVHILGYGIDPDNVVLKTFCQQIINRRQQAASEMIEKVNALGYDISVEEVSDTAINSTNIYKQHIMYTLMNKGYTDTMYGDLKNELFPSVGNGKAKVQVVYQSATDAVKVIKEAGGVPVLAHPGIYGNWNIIEELVAVGLEGIEVFHSEHGKDSIDMANTYVERFGLLKTAGSDFHGSFAKNEPRIGFDASIIPEFISLEQFEEYFRC